MFTGHLPLPFGVDLEVNALNKVTVIVGACAGIMSSPLTRSQGRLRWRDRSNPGILGSIEVGEALQRAYIVRCEELSVRAKEIVDAAFFSGTVGIH